MGSQKPPMLNPSFGLAHRRKSLEFSGVVCFFRKPAPSGGEKHAGTPTGIREAERAWQREIAISPSVPPRPETVNRGIAEEMTTSPLRSS